MGVGVHIMLANVWVFCPMGLHVCFCAHTLAASRWLSVAS